MDDLYKKYNIDKNKGSNMSYFRKRKNEMN